MKRLLLVVLSAMLVLLVIVTQTASAVTAKQISAKAIDDHECNPQEWHFVITEVKDEASAPSSIIVGWAGDVLEQVALSNYTGKTAHYTITKHLDLAVVSATAKIYADWGGQFNLSHGPCLPLPLKITLTSMCHTGEVGTMRLRNPNPVAVEVSWDIYGTSVSGVETVGANDEKYFSVPWPGTVRIRYAVYGQAFNDVKAQNNQECETPPTPPEPPVPPEPPQPPEPTTPPEPPELKHTQQILVVQIEAGWDGIPVHAWIGGTEQPVLYTAQDGLVKQDFSVHWSFQDQDGASYRVKVDRPAGKGENWKYWHWIDMPNGVYEVTDEVTGKLQNGETKIHLQLVNTSDPLFLVYKAAVDAYRLLRIGSL